MLSGTFSEMFTFIGYVTEHTPEEIEENKRIIKRAKEEWEELKRKAETGLPY